MSSDLFSTVRIRREAPEGTGDPDSTEDSLEFELVSTQMLEQILQDADDIPKNQIRELAETGDGWLARDTESERFEIVKDDELELALQSINNGAPSAGIPGSDFEKVDSNNDDTADDLCLVSTQHLRKILKSDSDEWSPEDPDAPDASDAGFNPYNNS